MSGLLPFLTWTDAVAAGLLVFAGLALLIHLIARLPPPQRGRRLPEPPDFTPPSRRRR